MTQSTVLFSDRQEFNVLWHPLCVAAGLQVRTAPPAAVQTAVHDGEGAVVDAVALGGDEDEVLATLGYLRARGLWTACYLPAEAGLDSLIEVVADLCPALLAREADSVPAVVQALTRRLDQGRAARFEFVTLCPDERDLLALFADGHAQVLERPVHDDDDESAVVAIELDARAQVAQIRLQSGVRLALDAPTLRRATSRTVSEPPMAESGLLPLGNGELGARLKALRLQAGLTQAELARRTGIHRPNIARVEAGRHTPSLDTLSRIAGAIGVPTGRVFMQS
ncbi:MAG: helix-turn-helix domain-containing protein [Polyangiales bacterium]